MIPDEVDVAIVGCGPVGALAANLLGRRGLRVAVLERERTAHGVPRAFSCDDEALRIYQQAGLACELRRGMLECPEAEFADERGEPFAVIRFEGLDFGSGYGALNFFHQPDLEAVLRAGFERFDGNVTLHLGQEACGLKEDSSGMTVSFKDTERGTTSELRARYVLACDGRRSAARRLAGIELVGSRYVEPWLAVSGVVESAPATMPVARFVCDPFRPGFVARGAGGQCRWEFMLRPGEAREEMEKPEAIARLIAPYVDPRAVRITRASIYTFENKVASSWRAGRLFLLGDAAHTMPPFMGQGLVSGLRDAANLAWKLALVLRGAAGDGLLDTYEEERRAHTKAMSDISVRLGHVFLVRSAVLSRARNLMLRALGRVDRFKRFVRDAEFKPEPVHASGAMMGGARRRSLPGGARAAEGTLFPQPFVKNHAGERVRLDDALGPGFAVLGMDMDPAALRRQLPLCPALETAYHRVVPGPVATREGDLADVEGKLVRWFEEHRARVAVLRPDRFVFGAGDAQAMGALGRGLSAALGR